MRRRAIVLMRDALTLLDEAGESSAARNLQMALDMAERVPIMKPGDELPEDDPPVSPEMAAEPALVRAIGGALAVIATLMARKDIASVKEVAQLLGIYAVATTETSPDEGTIIACWGAILREVAGVQDGES